MEQLLEQAKKVAEEAEVFSISHSETEAVFEANRLKQVQTHETSGRALRLIKNGSIGFSASNRANGTEKLVAMASEVAPFGAEARFQFPSGTDYRKVEVYDPEIEAVTGEQMVDMGQSLIDRVRGHTPEILCDAAVSVSTVTIGIVNSRGGSAAYRKSVFSFGVEGVLIRGTDMLFVGDADSSCHPLTDVNEVAANTIQQLERARETALSPKGMLPVIFTPHGAVSAFMAPLAMAVNGKMVLQGASPLGSRKGQEVFDEAITIWDDATIDYRPGSRLCDDEGMPGQRTPIIEKGVVSNFIYDLQTAALAGVQSTGSASRGLGSLPSPSITTLVIEDGEATFEDMLADIKEGLVIEQLMGASQGNVLGGEFSGNVLLGYAVKNGEIIGRVKDTMVSGNIYEVLKKASLSSGGKWIAGRLRTPNIFCPRIAVSTKG